MNQNTIRVMFALVRSAICSSQLSEQERALYSSDMLPNLLAISKRHDIAHLVAEGLNGNGLLPEESKEVSNEIIKAIYRYTQLNYEYAKLCDALEKAHIPFIPLKGSVLRQWYPEPWMRTSCDIDILVHKDEVEQTAEYLITKCGYYREGKGTHDISLFSPGKIHIELHYDLVEDGWANASAKVLNTVWETAIIRENKVSWFEMPDEMFYFYHIAHMAKHFERGGCGIRPFVDLWILEQIDNSDESKREKYVKLLEKGGLLKFANVAQQLSRVWFNNEEHNEITQQMEMFIFKGGVYGSAANSATVKAAKGEGKIRSFFKLMFLPRANLEVMYPNLHKHPVLLPFYQVKRWFRFFNKNKRKHIANLTSARNQVQQSEQDSVTKLLINLGLE